MKLIIIVLLFTTSSGFAQIKRGWDSRNNPRNIQEYLSTNLNYLPQESYADNIPWSAFNWSNTTGGIAFRWASPVQESFYYHLYSYREILNMTQDELVQLSPAEKYDILSNRFDYPTVQAEWKRTYNNQGSWYGLCHGRSSVALHYIDEPQYTIFYNSQLDLYVPFTSSDIKALLTYKAGVLTSASSRYVGQRCNRNQLSLSGACWDVNPGALHIALTNIIGREHGTLVVEMDEGKAVWNEPVWGYRTYYYRMNELSRHASPRAVRQIKVQTTIYYSHSAKPAVYPIGTVQRERTFVYTLELDVNNNIVGGEWISKKHPDFIWRQQNSSLTGYYSNIDQIYKLSISGSAGAEELGNQYDDRDEIIIEDGDIIYDDYGVIDFDQL